MERSQLGLVTLVVCTHPILADASLLCGLTLCRRDDGGVGPRDGPAATQRHCVAGQPHRRHLPLADGAAGQPGLLPAGWVWGKLMGVGDRVGGAGRTAVHLRRWVAAAHVLLAWAPPA